ncbi:MAG: prephenate dehydrogenase/arogenate dehydrogenase family protein [Nitrospirae bacterium]|nr:prephenate dehydrogenase/arogenate dehydrogenase family protein [Candidatus Manganitrophaceae bacterium]
MSVLFKQMTIIGVGLIGGSLALISKRKQLVETVVGYGRKRGGLQKAAAMGVIDRYVLTLPKAVEEADLIVLATPVGTFERICKAIAPHLKPGAIVTDVGSVKGAWVGRMEALLPKHAFFVGGHPIAGREKSGVEAATADLFQGSRCILTPTPATDRKALKKVASLWEKAGARVSELGPMEHDQILAAVSHLPHLVAYALMETLAHPKIAKRNPVEYSAGGLRDFTRIAGSSAEMWRDIFLLNRDAVVEMVDLYQETIEKIKKRILEEDGPGLIEIFERAKAIRQKAIQ